MNFNNNIHSSVPLYPVQKIGSLWQCMLLKIQRDSCKHLFSEQAHLDIHQHSNIRRRKKKKGKATEQRTTPRHHKILHFVSSTLTHAILGFPFFFSLFVASSLNLWGWWLMWSDCHLLRQPSHYCLLLPHQLSSRKLRPYLRLHHLHGWWSHHAWQWSLTLTGLWQLSHQCILWDLSFFSFFLSSLGFCLLAILDSAFPNSIESRKHTHQKKTGHGYKKQRFFILTNVSSSGKIHAYICLNYLILTQKKQRKKKKHTRRRQWLPLNFQ